jgi:hypothetical protein
MTAPLPLRFYNPVKDLCKKANLDYETVLGTALTNPTIRDAFINSELLVPLESQRYEDRQKLKKQKEFFATKYGVPITAVNGTGTAEDKGRVRYDSGLIVESVLPDDSESNKSSSVSDGVANRTASDHTDKELVSIRRGGPIWIPGRSDSVNRR